MPNEIGHLWRDNKVADVENAASRDDVDQMISELRLGRELGPIELGEHLALTAKPPGALIVVLLV